MSRRGNSTNRPRGWWRRAALSPNHAQLRASAEALELTPGLDRSAGRNAGRGQTITPPSRTLGGVAAVAEPAEQADEGGVLERRTSYGLGRGARGAATGWLRNRGTSAGPASGVECLIWQRS